MDSPTKDSEKTFQRGQLFELTISQRSPLLPNEGNTFWLGDERINTMFKVTAVNYGKLQISAELVELIVK